MKKIILTQDIVLSATDKAPGATGKLLVQQNNIGYHNVTLQTGNKGIISIGYKPFTVTLLTYINDDFYSYWTSETLTPESIINKPSQITNLTLVTLDTVAIEISWSAPMGNPPDALSIVDRYNIYVSESVITSSTNINSLPVYKQNIQPGLQGSLQTALLSGLDSNKRYYVAITSSRVSFGVQKISDVSNIITFVTHTTIKQELQVIPKRIPVHPKEAYAWRHGYAFDPLLNSPTDNRYLTGEYMVDYSGIIDDQGVPKGTLSQGLSASAYGGYQAYWYHENYYGMAINLDTFYSLEYIYINFAANPNGNTLTILVSEDGANYNVATILALDYTYTLAWKKISFLPEVVSGILKKVKFIRLQATSYIMAIKGFVLYGYSLSAPILLGKKHKKNGYVATFNERFGTNVLPHAEKLELTPAVGTVLRWYVEPEWLLSDLNNSGGMGMGIKDSDGSGTGIPLTHNDVKLRFASHVTMNWDLKVSQTIARGQVILLCYKETPRYLRSINEPDGTVYPAHNLRNDKPLDPGLSTISLQNTLNPQNYKHFARIFYNMAARFGSTVIADTQYIQLDLTPRPPRGTWETVPQETIRTGLNQIKYYECGNEHDRAWEGMRGYSTPAEWACKTSAAYDGHKGALGPGMGIRAADPNSWMIQGALVGMNINYWKEMVKWWDVNRGKGDYPIQAINVHAYNSWRASAQIETYSDAAHNEQYGIPPEMGPFRRETKALDFWIKENAPNIQLWLTEVGYDEHLNGRYSPQAELRQHRETYKAIWILRTFLISMADGIDVITQFWFSNTVFDYLANANKSQRETFYSAGYTNWVGTSNKLTSYFFVAAFRHGMVGYSLLNWVKDTGVQMTTDVIIESTAPSVYALSFIHTDGSKCIVTWLGSIGFLTINTKLRVLSSEINITKVDIDEIWTTKAEVSRSTVVSSLTDVSGRYIDITLTEYPTIYKTNNIGVFRLAPVEDIKIEVTSTSTLKIVWTDKNLGVNTTKVFISPLPDSNFTIYSNEYQDTASCLVTNLTPGTTYYFKLQFENGSQQSVVSPIKSATTLITIEIPTTFNQLEIKTTSILLGWVYSTLDQVNINSFEIYKCGTIDGVYVLLRKVSASTRAFRDIGLTQDTTYYYKIRAVGDLGRSDFSLTIAITTNEASVQPPVLMAAVTDYSGLIVILRFDLPMANPSGNEPYLNIIENKNSVQSLVNVTTVQQVPGDDVKLRLLLAYPLSPTSDITMSYDGVNGSIGTIFSIKLASISSKVITNKIGSSLLLARLFKINFAPATEAYNLNGWVDTGYNPTINLAGGQISALIKTTEGTASNIMFHAPVKYKLVNIGEPSYSTSTAMMGFPATPLPIETFFPRAVLKSGISILNKNQNPNGYVWSAIHFLNLDASKLYDIRIAINKTYTLNAGVRFIEWAREATPEVLSQVKSSSSDSDDLGFVLKRQTPLVQSVIVGTNTTDYVPNSSYTAAPSICILIRALGTTADKPFIISAFILEEYGDTDVTAPIIVDAYINDYFKNKVFIKYNEPLTPDILATTDFIVSPNKAWVDVDVSDIFLVLTADSNFAYSDQILISGGNNKIKDLDDNVSANLNNRAITNSLSMPDIVGPYIISATIYDTNKFVVKLVFNEPVFNKNNAISHLDYSIPNHGTSSIQVFNGDLLLSVSNEFALNEVISISGGNNKIMDVLENLGSNLNNYPVTNYIGRTDFTAPVVTSIYITDTERNVVNIAFNENIKQGIAFLLSDFPIIGKTNTAINIVDNKIRVTVSTNFVFDEVASISGGGGKIKDTFDNLADNISSTNITNQILEGLPANYLRIEFNGPGSTNIIKYPGNIWMPSTYSNASPTNPVFATGLGLGNLKLMAGVEGWLEFKINALTDKYSCLGFKTTPEVGQRSTMIACIFVGQAVNAGVHESAVQSVNSGFNNFTTLITPSSYPFYGRIRRSGTAIYIEYSFNYIDWILSRSWPNLTGATGILYPALDIANNGKITDAKGYNLISI